MSLAKRLYGMLLWLYPAEHRRAYDQQMLQHARDLYRSARKQGRWQVAMLCFRLLIDGILNAGIEYLEVIRMAKDRYNPLPWWIVLLAAFPGLLTAFSRGAIALLTPVFNVLGFLYLALLVLWPAITWWRSRRFPIWALLPAGLLVWFLTYFGGSALASGLNLVLIPRFRWIGMEVGITILDVLLAIGLFIVLLRGRRLPLSFWLVAGLILIINLGAAARYSLDRFGVGRLLPGGLTYFSSSGIGPVDGLFLVAAGLFAARQHGGLAILFVIGGYSYMCMDSDYLWTLPDRSWPYITLYLSVLVFVYLGLVPILMLRAKTGLGRAAAVFIPVASFHLARLVLPKYLMSGVLSLPWGDTILTINVLLVVLLAWVLYSQPGTESSIEESAEGISASSSPT
jgi:hypothetical protein